jgi:hypothetical protein
LDFYDEAARPTRSSSGVTPLRPPLTPTMPIKDVVGHDDIPALLCDLPAPPDGLLEAIARAIDGTRSVNDLARLLGCEREIVRTFVAELVDSDLARVERKDRDSRDYWLEGLRPRAPSSSRTPK